MRRIGIAVGIVAVSLAVASTAAAQSPPAAGAQPAHGDESKRDEARQRYQRGLQLFNEGNYEAARVEFERAYQLSPSYKILYNIGLCYEQLGDYVRCSATSRSAARRSARSGGARSRRSSLRSARVSPRSRSKRTFPARRSSSTTSARRMRTLAT
jgi:Tfp pilus assembly protein PilF